MKRPWIGIPTRYHEKTEYYGQIRHYLDAVLWAGGLPLMIPSVSDPDIVCEYAARVNGFLLPGSPTDIDPARYGAQPHPKLGKLYPERDATDFTLLSDAEAKSKPVLGICFGAQSLNVFRGGSLVQDIPAVVENSIAHDTANPSDSPSNPARHLVHIAEDSLIAMLAGTCDVEVNSYHHQAVSAPGQNLRAVAYAGDNVIEAIEDTRGRFVVGVQWHPERGFRTDGLSQSLFKALIEAAAL